MHTNITVTPLRAPAVIDSGQAARTLSALQDAGIHGARLSERHPAAARVLHQARRDGNSRCSALDRADLDALIDDLKASA